MSAENTPKRLLDNSIKFADEPAISVFSSNGWETDTWSGFTSLSKEIAKSLIALGIEKNDKVSIYSYNRKEWFGCYVATQMTGGAAVGVYHTSSPEEVEWVVSNSDSKIVFIGHNPMDNNEEEKMPNHRIKKVLDRLERVEHIVFFNGVDPFEHSKSMTWDEFIVKGKSIDEKQLLARVDSISMGDTASLIYTSGTTGNPKGVELTHDNWFFELESTNQIVDFNQGEKYVSWLPLAHVFGQLVDNHYWIKNAMHMYVVDNPLNVIDHAKEVQPHLFIGVPRIYEKVFSNIKATLDAKAVLKVLLKVPGLSGLLKGKLKEKIGMSNCRFAITGAAPINPDILTLFHSLDIPIFEGYGMTEDTAGATLSYQARNRIGYVGPAMPNTEMKVASDGELLIKGRHVMKGYYKNPEATAATIIDGWLHTGDVGDIDDEGFVKITGRKKEIYVTSGGKNIAPLVIEETMKSIPIISQCYLVGDGRKYCSALFTLDVGAIIRDKLGVEATEVPKNPQEQIDKLKELDHTLEDFTGSDEVKEEIQLKVDELNTKFSTPEQIKKFKILPRDLTVDDGELTPTLKIRRKQISDNWSSEIEEMYKE